jgi:hypothetical protein
MIVPRTQPERAVVVVVVVLVVVVAMAVADGEHPATATSTATTFRGYRGIRGTHVRWALVHRMVRREGEDEVMISSTRAPLPFPGGAS